MIVLFVILTTLKDKRTLEFFYAFEASLGNLEIFCGVKKVKFGCELSNILVRNQSGWGQVTPLVPTSLRHCFQTSQSVMYIKNEN